MRFSRNSLPSTAKMTRFERKKGEGGRHFPDATVSLPLHIVGVESLQAAERRRIKQFRFRPNPSKGTWTIEAFNLECVQEICVNLDLICTNELDY
jgi:hypothetical protein